MRIFSIFYITITDSVCLIVVIWTWYDVCVTLYMIHSHIVLYIHMLQIKDIHFSYYRYITMFSYYSNVCVFVYLYLSLSKYKCTDLYLKKNTLFLLSVFSNFIMGRWQKLMVYFLAEMYLICWTTKSCDVMLEIVIVVIKTYFLKCFYKFAKWKYFNKNKSVCCLYWQYWTCVILLYTYYS